MSDRDEAIALLESARRDARALGAMTDPAAFAEEIFGFHVQQAIEKALKAWLVALGAEYPRTHDLSLLLLLLESHGHDVAALQPLVRWTAFAAQLRYAMPDPPGERSDRAAACTAVTALLGQVEAVLR